MGCAASELAPGDTSSAPYTIADFTVGRRRRLDSDRRHLHLRLSDRRGGADRDRDERWLAHHAERAGHGDGRQYIGVGIYFNGNAAGDECVDATAHTGVKFDISGIDRGDGLHGPVLDQRQRALGRDGEPDRQEGGRSVGRVRAAGGADGHDDRRDRHDAVQRPGAPAGGSPATASTR